MRKPCALLRVTEHIPEIIQFVQQILKNGHAYVAPSGSVYFDTKGFKSYGQAFGISTVDSEGTNANHANLFRFG